MSTHLGHDTESSFSARPIALDDAAELVAELQSTTRIQLRDFTMITGHDQRGRKVTVILGSLAGDAAVIASDSFNLAIAA